MVPNFLLSRYMYWTDYGHESSKVARMGMDGSNMKILAEGTDALFPTGIAIDFEGNSTFTKPCSYVNC